MGWGTIGGMIGGSIGSAISNALNGNSNKPNNSGSGSSSGTGRLPSINGSGSRPSGSSGSSGSQSSFGGSGGGSSGSGGGGNHSYGDYSGGSGVSGLTTQEIQDLQRKAAANSSAWASADDAKKAQLHDENKRIYSQLGYDYDDSTGSWSPGSRFDTLWSQAQRNDLVDNVAGGFDQYYGSDAQREQEELIRRQNEAAVQQNVNALGAQKNAVQQQGKENDAAAYSAYMDVMNPNGALAEQLAARGLTQSGISESSMIDAGNSLQNAYNSNRQTVTQTLADIDLAIENARLSGDLATAQQLAAYKQQVAAAGMQNMQYLAGLQQWGIENGQQQAQNAINNAFAEAGLTGMYDGQKTMAGQQNDKTLESMTIENQVAQWAFDMEKRFGVSQRQFELDLMQLQAEGYALDNAQKELQRRYMRQTLGY